MTYGCHQKTIGSKILWYSREVRFLPYLLKTMLNFNLSVYRITDDKIMKNSFYLNKRANDDIFVNNSIVPMNDLIGMETRKGLEQGIISNGKLVNVVSSSYGHLRNEDFFLEFEAKLIEADIITEAKYTNRDDRSFSAMYILKDDRYKVDIKGKDIMQPMIKLVNSYDGSNKTSGHFGMFRQVCSNGLCVAHTDVAFSQKHTSKIGEVVFPKLDDLVETFLNNEFFEIKRKFDILAEQRIYNVENYVKDINQRVKLFKYEASDKNPNPSANARIVLDVIQRETIELNERPNKWIVYNAFNELLHGKLGKTFDQQRIIDERIFETILAN